MKVINLLFNSFAVGAAIGVVLAGFVFIIMGAGLLQGAIINTVAAYGLTFIAVACWKVGNGDNVTKEHAMRACEDVARAAYRKGYADGRLRETQPKESTEEVDHG
jgi:hypothetical protein